MRQVTEASPSAQQSDIPNSEHPVRVGVEVGGTFTDLIVIAGDSVNLLKVPSTPDAPEGAVMNAVAAAGIDLRAVGEFIHGSTVATNTILERKGFRTAFVTTAGFRDILEIQRHDRRHIYDISYQKPRQVIAREDCFEVHERIDGKGRVVVPLNETDVIDRLAPQLAAGNYASIAICLLNAHENPTHEQRLADLLQGILRDLRITCSSQVIREFREYERASTTALSAYVQPVIDRYLGRLEDRLREQGFAGNLSIMQSSGGRIPVAGMRQCCISAFLSGPAAGVVGATRQAARSGITNLITFDMGGTSSDVCLVANSQPETAPQSEVDGLPIRYPMVDIVTIGAGGGSIVSVDEGGMLRVGPQSAGANPGPACYGKGGTLPTVTDAHVICGTLQPGTFLGGKMPLDRDAAWRVFEPLARALCMSVEDVADSALSLATANIVRAIQTVSTERGRDPRDFALMPFGGAGPLCSTAIADELGTDLVVVPPNPGVMSAYGLLAADYVLVDVQSFYGPVEDHVVASLREAVSSMIAAAHDNFCRLGTEGHVDFRVLLDMRFKGQAFELQLPLTETEALNLSAGELASRFRDLNASVFLNRAPGDRPVEFVSIRLISVRPNPQVPRLSWASTPGASAERVAVRRNGISHDCRQIYVNQIGTGDTITGPALIVSDTSSIYADAGWTVTRDAADNLLLRKVTE
jgi:N-methylhydantoinase A